VVLLRAAVVLPVLVVEESDDGEEAADAQEDDSSEPHAIHGQYHRCSSRGSKVSSSSGTRFSSTISSPLHGELGVHGWDDASPVDHMGEAHGEDEEDEEDDDDEFGRARLLLPEVLAWT